VCVWGVGVGGLWLVCVGWGVGFFGGGGVGVGVYVCTEP